MTSQRIALLVNNSCIYDSRVIRTAEALAAAGNAVTVICRHGSGLPLLERRNNVLYCRVKFMDKSKKKNASFSEDLEKPIFQHYEMLELEDDIYNGPDDTLLIFAGKGRVARPSDLPAEELAKFLFKNASNQGDASLSNVEVQEKSVNANATRRKIISMSYLLNQDFSKVDPAIFSSKDYEKIEKAWEKIKSTRGKIVRKIIFLPFKTVEKFVDLKKRSTLGRKILLTLNVSLLRAVINRTIFVRRITRNTISEIEKIKYGDYWAWFKNILLLRTIYPRTVYACAAVTELTFFKPDIIHCNELNTLEPAVYFKNAVYKTPVRIIYDSHELETGRDSIKSNRDRRSIEKYEGRLIKHSDAVITVSNGLAEHMGELYNIPTPTVVYNAPEVFSKNKKPSNSRRLRKDIGLKKSVPLGVYVGRLKLGRGHELILKGLAQTEGIHMAMVGVQPLKVIKAQQELVASLGIEDRVYFVPPVSTDEVVSYISEADFGIVPTQNIGLSYKYAMPNKLFEMSLSGLPIIGGRLPEIRRYIESTNVGIVMDETDPVDIARAITEIYCNRENYKKTDVELDDLIAKYSWSVQKKKLFKVHGLPCMNDNGTE